jgi:tetratricopeptide (TPR) repeat protein
MEWNRIARLSLAGQTLKVLPEYDRLYRWLGRNGLFLYNHAAELHEVEEFEKSIAVFGRCMRCYNDMDVQMLLADSYQELGKYPEAERHLKTAAAMCPVRFVPLYELAKLYDATDRKAETVELAETILAKEVKIPSATIAAVKNEMRQLLERENRDSAPQGGTSDEPENNEIRQDETPEVQPHSAVLPP